MVEKRSCRFWSPLLFMMLEIVGIVEGALIVYFLYNGIYIIPILTFIAAIILLKISIEKTKHVYKTRCTKKFLYHRHRLPKS